MGLCRSHRYDRVPVGVGMLRDGHSFDVSGVGPGDLYVVQNTYMWRLFPVLLVLREVHVEMPTENGCTKER